MAAPVIGITLDKASYLVGATITATVTYSDPDARAYTLTGVATDAEGNHTNATATFAVADPVSLAITDDDARKWTKVSDTGSVAVYTATA